MERINKQTISLAEILYYISFSLLLAAKGLGFYDGQPIFKLCLILSVAAWLGKMWLTRYTVKELIKVIGMLALTGVIYLVSGEKGALLYALMITGLKNVPVKRVFALGTVVWTITFLGNAWLNALHLADGPFKVHEKLGMGMVIRWGLGQSHPNVLHISFLVWVMFVVYLMGKKYDWKAAVLLMVGNVLMYLYSVSSTGVIAVTFYLGLSLYWRYRGKLNRAETVLIRMVLPVCLCYSLLAPILLQGDLFIKVNDLTNTRLELARRFLTENPVTLFGVRLSDIITSQLTMDNSFVFAFVTYGIVLFVGIVFSYIWLTHKYCKEQRGNELCVMLTCFVAGIMEPFLFNTSYKNISLLFMKDLVFEEEKEAVLCMPGYFEREYRISAECLIPKRRTVAEILKKYRKVLFLVAVAGILAGGIACHIFWQRPERILVPESACDVGVIQRTEETLDFAYLSSAGDAPQQTDLVIGFTDSKERMIIYSGGIVQMESIRNHVCAGFTVGVLAALGAAVICRMKEAGHAGRKRTKKQNEVLETAADRE